MAKVRMTAVRNFLGTIFAIILIILLLAVVAAVFDWNIPVISDIGNTIGL